MGIEPRSFRLWAVCTLLIDQSANFAKKVDTITDKNLAKFVTNFNKNSQIQPLAL